MVVIGKMLDAEPRAVATGCLGRSTLHKTFERPSTLNAGIRSLLLAVLHPVRY